MILGECFNNLHAAVRLYFEKFIYLPYAMSKNRERWKRAGYLCFCGPKTRTENLPITLVFSNQRSVLNILKDNNKFHPFHISLQARGQVLCGLTRLQPTPKFPQKLNWIDIQYTLQCLCHTTVKCKTIFSKLQWLAPKKACYHDRKCGEIDVI